MLVLQYAYFLLLPLLCSERRFLCRKDKVMDIDKLLVKIDNLKKLQDNIAYEITQVVSKANAISEILYSISYEDALSDLKYKLECIETIMNNK